MTPAQETYFDLCEKYPGTLPLLKVGDFYEAFGEHAKTLARVLEIALTKRKDLPMAGVPYHAVWRSLNTLRAAGIVATLAEPLPGGGVKIAEE